MPEASGAVVPAAGVTEASLAAWYVLSSLTLDQQHHSQSVAWHDDSGHSLLWMEL